MTNPLESLFAEGHSTLSPPMFDGTNYNYWRVRIKYFIQANDYKMWHAIFNNLDINDSHYIFLNTTTIKLLYSALDSHVQNRIGSCASALEIWDKLENIFKS